MNSKIYCEWVEVISDYFQIIEQNEKNFEIRLPFYLTVIIIIIYTLSNKVLFALNGLCDTLPNILAVLVGFSITCLTVLVTTDNENVKLLKTNMTERVISSKRISVYQLIVINFSYILLIQIGLLIQLLFSKCLINILNFNLINIVLLSVQVFAMIHIFMLMVRNITTFYFVHYRKI